MNGARQCPLCSAEGECVFDLGTFEIVDCPACGHRFADGALANNHVSTVYGDDYFFGGKDGYDDYLADGALLRQAGFRYGNLLKRHAMPGRLLDVGAAAGFLQVGYEDAGWETLGLEPNARMSAYAREVLCVESRLGDLESTADLPEFDVVSLVQVIGHFHDLARALDRVRDLTRSGGLVLIEYWRHDSWIAQRLGKNWPEYSPPSVLHYFSRDSLDRMMTARGLRYAAHGSPKKYISGQHASSLLAHKLSQSPLGRWLSWMPGLVPAGLKIRYPAFDLEWRLYRREGVAD